MVAEELEGFFEVVVLGKAAQGDVDRRLELVLVGLDDVGEDAALGGFVDEVLVSCVEDEDDRAGGVADDLLDQFERVLGALAEPDERDVGMFLAGQLDDLLDVQFLPDDLVAERAGDLGDGLGPLGALVGDEYVQQRAIRAPVVNASVCSLPSWSCRGRSHRSRRGRLRPRPRRSQEDGELCGSASHPSGSDAPGRGPLDVTHGG